MGVTWGNRGAVGVSVLVAVGEGVGVSVGVGEGDGVDVIVAVFVHVGGGVGVWVDGAGEDVTGGGNVVRGVRLSSVRAAFAPHPVRNTSPRTIRISKSPKLRFIISSIMTLQDRSGNTKRIGIYLTF